MPKMNRETFVNLLNECSFAVVDGEICKVSDAVESYNYDEGSWGFVSVKTNEAYSLEDVLDVPGAVIEYDVINGVKHFSFDSTADFDDVVLYKALTI